MKTKRKYSDREKAQALATLDANEGNVARTARMLKIPMKTLADWRDGMAVVPDVAEFRIEEKMSLADKLDAIAHQCAGLLPERLPRASVREIVGAMGQSIEKGQLLRGAPTAITANQPAKSLAQLVFERTGEQISEEQAEKIMNASIRRANLRAVS